MGVLTSTCLLNINVREKAVLAVVPPAAYHRVSFGSSSRVGGQDGHTRW